MSQASRARRYTPSHYVPLAAGSRLGAYRIVSVLGAGGMGEVYRAVDTDLKREVAIKVLPASLAGDAERLARFRREAEVLASLNHPNIAHIHGLEKFDGTIALVMELVEGPTLADRVSAGPIPLDEALAIARQIAEGLEAAHEQGIIHRDLKPANIKVRPDGAVKVLDFGLAKAVTSGISPGDVTQAPTIASPAVTAAGMIVGTVAYMSPEQARGKAVDKRTDVWAFGCLLYEMIVGRPAFPPGDAAMTLAEVIKSEPQWSALPSNLPRYVAAILQLCLRKDPLDRVRDIRDIRLVLEGGFAGPPEWGGGSVATAPSGRTRSGRTQATMRRLLPWVAALVLSATAGATVWFTRPAAESRVSRTEIRLPSVGPWLGPMFALAPDGQSLVMVEQRPGGTRLLRRALGQLTPTPIPGAETVVGSPFFSPDGRSIGFVAKSLLGYALRTIPTSGGAATTVCDFATPPLQPAWFPDNSIVFDSPRGLMAVAAEGGAPRLLVEGTNLRGPQPLRNGAAVLFHVRPTNGDDGSIEVLVLASGERRKIGEGTDARYVATGHLVFAHSDGSLWAAPFNQETLRTTNEAVRLDMAVFRALTTSPLQFAVADNGTLVYVPVQTQSSANELMWVDAHGKELGPMDPRSAADLPATHSYAYPRVSPNGNLVAFEMDGEIWAFDLHRHTTARLTHNREGRSSVAGIIAWTADGQRVTYIRAAESATGGGTRLESAPADGTGAVQVHVSAAGLLAPGSWSKDGLTLAYHRRSGADRDLWVIRPGPPIEDRAFVATPHNERVAMFSPDAQWIAYVSDESGVDQVYVKPLVGDGARQTVSDNGGTEPVWARNGGQLFYRRGDAMMAVAVAAAGGDLSLGRPEVLFERTYARDSGGANGAPFYDVTPDGRFLMVTSPRLADITAVLVQNWFEELKRLVPTK